jgi:hypothetical protein
MSDEREIARVSSIIASLIKKVDHGKDLDKTLNVFTEARGLFINLYEVLNLAIRCHAMVQGRHN